jgi:hypothetical protein
MWKLQTRSSCATLAGVICSSGLKRFEVLLKLTLRQSVVGVGTCAAAATARVVDSAAPTVNLEVSLAIVLLPAMPPVGGVLSDG